MGSPENEQQSAAPTCNKCGAVLRDGYCASCDPECECPAYCPKHMKQSAAPESQPKQGYAARKALKRIRERLGIAILGSPGAPISWNEEIALLDRALAAPCECERLREQFTEAAAQSERFRQGMVEAQRKAKEAVAEYIDQNSVTCDCCQHVMIDVTAAVQDGPEGHCVAGGSEGEGSACAHGWRDEVKQLQTAVELHKGVADELRKQLAAKQP